MGILEGVRVAEHVARDAARIVNANSDANPRQAVPPRVRQQAGGTVACRADQAPARPPAERIDGGRWLNIADVWMSKYIHMPDAARHTCVLYVAAQHFRLPNETRRLAWPRCFGRVALLAANPGSGKTTAMALMGYMCKPFFSGISSNPTARGLGHSINEEHAALFIDEAHRLFGPKGTRKPDVVTILNTGYEVNGSTVDGLGGKTHRLKTYGPAVFAGKDEIRKSGAEELSDLFDRCVAIIDMEQPPEDVELAEPDFETEEDGGRIAEKMAQWAAQEMADVERFREAYRVACAAAKADGLRGRAKDVWVPLLATAWLAGPVFLNAARDAASEFRLNRPVEREPEPEAETVDPLADLEARLTGGGEVPSWG